MKANTSILVPIDLDKAAHSIDALRLAHRICSEPAVTATLFYAINLNIARLPLRVYEEMATASELELQGLAGVLATGGRNVNTSVRFGIPHVEIVAEAASRQSELIIMTCAQASRFGWLRGAGTVGNVMNNAPCPTLILPCDGNVTADHHEWRQLFNPMAVGGKQN